MTWRSVHRRRHVPEARRDDTRGADGDVLYGNQDEPPAFRCAPSFGLADSASRRSARQWCQMAVLTFAPALGNLPLTWIESQPPTDWKA